MSTITVDCGYNRKKKVKTTPVMKLSDVLETTCAWLKVNAANYRLLRADTGEELDTSLPIRFANLPSRATLKLEEKEQDGTLLSITSS